MNLAQSPAVLEESARQEPGPDKSQGSPSQFPHTIPHTNRFTVWEILRLNFHGVSHVNCVILFRSTIKPILSYFDTGKSVIRTDPAPSCRSRKGRRGPPRRNDPSRRRRCRRGSSSCSLSLSRRTRTAKDATGPAAPVGRRSGRRPRRRRQARRCRRPPPPCPRRRWLHPRPRPRLRPSDRPVGLAVVPRALREARGGAKSAPGGPKRLQKTENSKKQLRHHMKYLLTCKRASRAGVALVEARSQKLLRARAGEAALISKNTLPRYFVVGFRNFFSRCGR